MDGPEVVPTAALINAAALYLSRARKSFGKAERQVARAEAQLAKRKPLT
ncbi:MAG TPA: hypothetical protein VGB97_00420 [Candidatus Paceibacterota bacterium]|jgi:hypothetical protein